MSDRIADRSGGGPALRVIDIHLPLLLQPVSDKRLDVLRQFAPVADSASTSKFSKPHQNGNAAQYVLGRIALFSQPGDVLLNRLAEPARMDPVDCGGANKIMLQHDNLLSEDKVKKEIIALVI